MARLTFPQRIVIVCIAVAACVVLLPKHASAVQAAPGVMTFTAQQGGPNPAPQNVVVSIAGGATWHATVSSPWVTLSKMTGGPVAMTIASVTVSNTLAPNALPYSATVDFIDDTGASPTATVIVRFTVTASPVLSVSKTSFTFTTTQGNNPADQMFSVQSGGPGGWTGTTSVAPGLSWLSIAPASGTAAEYNDPSKPVRVKINTAGLLIGQYQGTVTVTSAGAVPGSIDIPVTLKITSAPILDTSPRSITLNVEQGNSASPTLQIVNNGGSETELSWQIVQPAETWLRLSLSGCTGPYPASVAGNTAGGRKTAVSVCIDTIVPAVLPLGNHTSTLKVVVPAGTMMMAPGVDSVLVSITVINHTSKPTVVPGTLVYTSEKTCGPPNTYKITITWDSSENGDTQLKWGETLDANGVPQYERGIILKPEGLNTVTHTGGVISHSVTLDNLNLVYGGHRYYFAIRSTDRWGLTGDWTDHDPMNPAMFLSITTNTCDQSAPNPVVLQVPATSPLHGSITIVMSAQDESLVTSFELFRAPNMLVVTIPVPATLCQSTGQKYSCQMTYSLNTKLFPNAAINLFVRAFDALGYSADSGIKLINVDNTVPKVSNVAATASEVPANSGNWQAAITWVTDVGSDSAVQYGTEDDEGNFKGYTNDKTGDDLGGNDLFNHTVTLTNLSAGRVYHYMVTSCPQNVSDPDRCGH
ncbi:MAG: fibronectin type III domain-containing protein [Candidatus Kerfeldbacteria bacterium]